MHRDIYVGQSCLIMTGKSSHMECETLNLNIDHYAIRPAQKGNAKEEDITAANTISDQRLLCIVIP